VQRRTANATIECTIEGQPYVFIGICDPTRRYDLIGHRLTRLGLAGRGGARLSIGCVLALGLVVGWAHPGYGILVANDTADGALV
jgi:hypothetical protein